MNTTITRTLAAAAALTIGLTLAGCSTNNAASSDNSSSSSSSAASAHNDQDVMFAQQMLPHHKQAVEMSDMLLAKGSAVDADVVTLAKQIKAEQGPEITSLTSWLKQWGEPTEMSSMSGMDHSSMSGIETVMPFQKPPVSPSSVPSRPAKSESWPIASLRLTSTYWSTADSWMATRARRWCFISSNAPALTSDSMTRLLQTSAGTFSMKSLKSVNRPFSSRAATMPETTLAPTLRIAVSPIVGGKALKGPADRMLATLGHEVSSLGVARIYAGLIDLLVIDDVDAELVPAIEALGIRTLVTGTIMGGPEDRERLAREILDVAMSGARS